MLSSLRNMFKVPELRNKILFTLLIIGLYQLGANVPVPGVNWARIQQLQHSAGASGVLGFLNLFSGGALVRLAIFGLASIAPVMFDSPMQIIIARAVAGAGAAFIMPATLSLLTAAFPKSERNKAVGIWAGMASSGAVFGFLGTGILMHFFSWQSIFYAFTAAAVGMFICTCTIGSSRDESATPIDWIGAVLIGAAVAVFVFGVIQAPDRGWTNPVVWGCMTAGVALAAGT